MNAPVAAEKVGFAADADSGSLQLAGLMRCMLADLESILVPVG